MTIEGKKRLNPKNLILKFAEFISLNCVLFVIITLCARWNKISNSTLIHNYLKKNHLTTFHAPLFVYLTTQNDQFHKTTYFYHSITVHIYVLPEVDMLLYLYLIWTLPIPFVPNRFPFRLFMYRDFVQIRLGAIGNEGAPLCARTDFNMYENRLII